MSSEVMSRISRRADALPVAMLAADVVAGFVVHPDQEIDLRVNVDRARQRLASQAHTSQALPSSVLWRRLELRGNNECVRWLREPLDATVTS